MKTWLSDTDESHFYLDIKNQAKNDKSSRWN